MNKRPGNGYKLEDLIDIKHFQDIQDRLNKIYTFPSSIIDNGGNILTATGWQEICTDFHRKNKECKKACIQSDKYILDHINEADPAVTYKCPHGLVDNATPIIIDGIHYGNFFTGQFFLEAPDIDFFKKQAKKYSFPEKAYLEVVKKVPIWTKSQLENYLYLIKGLIAIISESGLKNLKEVDTRKQIQESERRYKSIIQTAMDGFWLLDRHGNFLEVNDAYCRMSGYTRLELLHKKVPDLEANNLQAEIENNAKEIIKKGTNRFVKTHRRKDGSLFEVEMSIQFLPEKDGIFVCFLQDITKRKLAEEALIASEARYRLMSQYMSDVLFTMDARTEKFTYISPSVMKLRGFSPEEVMAHPMSATCSPDVYKKLLELQSGRIKIFLDNNAEPMFFIDECEQVCKDGSLVPTEVSTTLVVNDKGDIEIIGVARDISERKIAEKALVAKTEELDRYFNRSLDLLCIADTDGYFRRLNPEWEKTLGYSIKELEGRRLLDFIHPDDFEATIKVIETLQNQKEVLNFLNRYRAKDGNYHWIEWRAFPDGKIIYATARDITWRRIAETEREAALTALGNSEKKHRTILQTAIDGFMRIDKNGNIIDVNDAYCKMSGYQHEELLNLPASILEVDMRSEEKEQILKEIVQKKIFRFTRQHKRKDGTIIYVEISTQYYSEDGEFVCFIRDITEKKEMESRLHQAQKIESIGTLAGGIAHDFNNILSPIMLNAELAIADLPQDDPLQITMKEIFAAALRARDLVRQILTFARKSPEKRIILKASQIVEEALKFLHSTIPASVNISYLNRSDNDTLLAEPSQVSQIIMNLCTNAAHAMREKGKLLEITLENEEISLNNKENILNLKPGSYLKLSVKDDGTGIPPDIIERIFEPYYTTKKTGEGTGLGLATVHGIVKNYEGEISVESRLGYGTTFIVYLPLIDVTVSGDVNKGRQEIPKGNERILFVDDEPAVVNITQRMLEKYGYKVTSTTSSIEALDIFRNNPGSFDLVITDMAMPDISGDALACKIMAIRPDMPVILCTGFSNKINEEMADKLGIKYFVMKPVIMSELAKKIRDILYRDKNARLNKLSGS